MSILYYYNLTKTYIYRNKYGGWYKQILRSQSSGDRVSEKSECKFGHTSWRRLGCSTNANWPSVKQSAAWHTSESRGDACVNITANILFYRRKSQPQIYNIFKIWKEMMTILQISINLEVGSYNSAFTCPYMSKIAIENDNCTFQIPI